MCDKKINNENKYLEGKTLLYVDDFGAIGDGVHDDAIAIRDCCEAAAKLSVPAAVVFTAGKVYYAGSLEGKYPWTSPWSETTVIYFENTRDITIEGNGCRLELGHSIIGLFNLYSENIFYHNIYIDHKNPTFVSGVIERFDDSEKCFNVKTKYSMEENLIDGMFEVQGTAEYYYALPNFKDSVRRNCLSLKKIVLDGDCKYRIMDTLKKSIPKILSKRK